MGFLKLERSETNDYGFYGKLFKKIPNKIYFFKYLALKSHYPDYNLLI